MALTDRLPRELLTHIFRIVAQQKVVRKSFDKYKQGYHLVPHLRSSSRVCKEWRNLILGNTTSCTRALSLSISFGLDDESQMQWTEDFQLARDLILKHPYCPIVAFLDLRDIESDSPERAPEALADLVRLLDTISISERLQAIDFHFYSDLALQILVAFADRTIPCLEFLGLASYDTSMVQTVYEGAELESATFLSGSVFPRPSMFDDMEPNQPFHDHPKAHLIYSGLKDLTGIRIMCCSVEPDWTDLTGILIHNPELQSLDIQMNASDPSKSSAVNEVEFTDTPLASLEKCSIVADVLEIWQFLSIPGITGLKYLSLCFNALRSYESLLIPVLKTDLSKLLYLSLNPLCSVTASFLAKTEMPCLATLNFIPDELDNTTEWYNSEDKWPHCICLPALTTLRVAGAEVVHATLFLRASATGAGSLSLSSHLLRSLTIDVTLWQTADGSDKLQEVFSEKLFCGITTLSIEQGMTVVTARFLETILSFMPSVNHLYLSQTYHDEWTPVLPLVYEYQYPQPNPFTQLSLLEIKTCHTQREHAKDGYNTYLSHADEAELVQHLQNRYEHEVVQQLQIFQDPYDVDQENLFHLKVLRLRVYPMLREETKVKVESMKCLVEDHMDLWNRPDAVDEYDEL